MLVKAIRDVLGELETESLQRWPAETPESMFYFRYGDRDEVHVSAGCAPLNGTGLRWEPGPVTSSALLPCHCIRTTLPSWVETHCDGVQRFLSLPLSPAPAILNAYSSVESLRQPFPETFVLLSELSTLLVELLSQPYWKRQRGVTIDAPMCTVKLQVPQSLEFFPNGAPAVSEWRMLPQDAARWCSKEDSPYVLTGVDGWSADRVTSTQILMRELSDPLEAFKVAPRMVV